MSTDNKPTSRELLENIMNNALQLGELEAGKAITKLRELAEAYQQSPTPEQLHKIHQFAQKRGGMFDSHLFTIDHLIFGYALTLYAGNPELAGRGKYSPKAEWYRSALEERDQLWDFVRATTSLKVRKLLAEAGRSSPERREVLLNQVNQFHEYPLGKDSKQMLPFRDESLYFSLNTVKELDK